MKLIRPLLFCCCLLLAGSISAQDFHWTLFNYSPLTLNPAFTGAYSGSFRVGGIARDQAPGLNYSNSTFQDPNVFLSYNFFVDAPIITGFRKQDWLGVGINFYSDEAGALSYGQNYFQGSVAYHIGLDKKQKSVFTIGLHGGQGAINFDGEQAIFAEDLETNFNYIGGGGGYSPGTNESSHFELGGGLLFRSQVNKKTGFNMGLSFKHIVPVRTFGLADRVARPLGITFHTQVDAKLNKKWSITPALGVFTQGPSSQVQVQGMMGYFFNEEKNVVLNFGLGYRLGDAGQFLLGMDYGSFRVAASFDLTLSGASEINNNVGGFELGVSYIGKIFKDPAVKPVIFCPRF